MFCSSKEPDQEDVGDMGKSRPDTEGGDHSAKGKHHVLQGSHAVCPPLWQQDVEPLNNCAGAAGGVSYLRSLPHGWKTQAKEGTPSWVGVSLF